MPNSLESYYRQPQLHITLPSGGKWWAPGSVEFSANNELPVMPMTARDELAIKQPDALMNGQATVDVIQSCIPMIKNAWSMPSCDVDTILLAIRIATYGTNMDVITTVPKVQKPNTVQVDLNYLLDSCKFSTHSDTVALDNGLIVEIRPLSYKQLTDIQLHAYEEQRMVRNITDSKLTEDEKIKQYQSVFLKLTNYTVERLSNSVVSITTPQETVTDRNQIYQFISNIDTKTADQIKQKMEELRLLGSIKPIQIATPQEFIDDGAPDSYETAINMDNSNFFGLKSFRSRNLS